MFSIYLACKMSNDDESIGYPSLDNHAYERSDSQREERKSFHILGDDSDG
jgi:hypothetical protein